MLKSLRILTLSALLLSPAFAQETTVAPTTQDGRLVIVSPEIIRYTVDPNANTVTLPNVHLGEGAKFPEGTQWKQRGADLIVTLPVGATVSLSPDNKRLTILPANTLTAIPKDERAPIFLPLANAQPALVAALVTRLYANVRVEVDERQRALLILVNPADRQLITDLVRQLDTERPQVMFEAEILEVNQDLTTSLGLQYDSIFTFKLTEGDAPQLLNLGKVGRSPLTLSLGLNALKANGAARVLAQPRVTTLDGLEARINSTQTTPVIVPGANNTQSVQNITTGITLRMTPKVAPDGTVEANLSISVSTPTGTTSQGVPQFSSREASTTVRVRNGEPIAIGGLLENRKIEATQKVPLLGDLPIIGKLFTTTRTETRNTDLVIIVTPRLVLSPNQR
ncbi:type II secretion system protein GspD [Deinococcus peraridilitoris]|uniref:Type II secretory pathway, component PulD n=1 Tax=Deinococcus peraridilitoris (strain DSM 19664 / LMG 22246 / CIP 109416 / KR-200) TaxID=937777 RepID=L0A036_DEIPD|nr:secretin N-terminal domain-containing protein [Deinococcus peraridilitoris]AFZ67196.1 type II secretory pathway, component PulD [Deinococcus peraridilitoris DSM 19664]